ncbi:MAG: hypothetical protein HN380_19675 [Victivallales bacterium]|jgi:hypothetical protein|nr:hypothetical protein [Victivallales bacterium]
MSNTNRKMKRNQDRLRAKAEEQARNQFLTIMLGMRRGPLAARIKMAKLLICGYPSPRKTIRERLWNLFCNAFAILCFTSPFLLLGLLIRRAMG